MTLLITTQKSNPLEQLKLQYNDYNDPLSIEIREWIEESSRIGAQCDPESQVEFVIERITLFNKILINPLVPHERMNSPVILGSWAYDANTYREVKRLFKGVSPLDQCPMVQEPSRHEFAEATLSLIDSIIETPTQKLTHWRQDDRTLRNNYIQNAQLALFSRQQKMMRAAMKASRASAHAAIVAIHRNSELAIQEAEERNSAHLEALRHQYNALKNAHQGTIARIYEQIAVVQAQTKSKINALEAQIATEVATGKKIANTMRNDIQKAEVACAATVASMHQELSITIQNQKNSEQMLEQAINRADSERARQRDAENAFRKQIDALSHTTQSSLETIKRQQDEINRLRNKLDDKCVIL